jgi:hypothetical protein
MIGGYSRRSERRPDSHRLHGAAGTVGAQMNIRNGDSEGVEGAMDKTP